MYFPLPDTVGITPYIAYLMTHVKKMTWAYFKM